MTQRTLVERWQPCQLSDSLSATHSQAAWDVGWEVILSNMLFLHCEFMTSS